MTPFSRRERTGLIVVLCIASLFLVAGMTDFSFLRKETIAPAKVVNIPGQEHSRNDADSVSRKSYVNTSGGKVEKKKGKHKASAGKSRKKSKSRKPAKSTPKREEHDPLAPL